MAEWCATHPLLWVILGGALGGLPCFIIPIALELRLWRKELGRWPWSRTP